MQIVTLDLQVLPEYKQLMTGETAAFVGRPGIFTMGSWDPEEDRVTGVLQFYAESPDEAMILYFAVEEKYRRLLKIVLIFQLLLMK